MLASERQQQILVLLEETGTLRTIDLAEKFQVTDETIRRDLQALAESHMISRVHGGAKSLSGRPTLQSFAERRALQVEKKTAIARAALDLIQPGRTYAFDSSTTGYELVCALPDEAFRVVTNAYAVIDRLVTKEHVDLIATGGRYQPKTQTFIGAETVHTLRRHNINTAFVSCIGLDLDKGASEGFEDQALFKETLMDQAEEVVMLVDSSKFDQRSEYFFANLKDISLFITDSDADPKFIASLREKGCAVTIAQL